MALTRGRGLHRRGVLAGLSAALVAQGGYVAAAEPMRIVLFDTAAFFEPAAGAWVVPLHAWVHAPVDSRTRKRAIAALFKAKYGLQATAETQALFDARINLLLADNRAKVTPRVLVDDLAYRLPPTGANGHTRFEAVIKGAPDDIALPHKVVAPDSGASAFVQRLAVDGASVICDIDDTVKDSGVLDKRRLWDSTFFKPFQAVPGMAALITRLAGPERAVHYVSSSPWHLYEPLRTWLIADGFPCTALHLKQIRLKDSSIFDILASPEKTKPPLIAEILMRFPRRTFTLVGDSGEKDPEVYASVARRFPKQVSRILIRRAPGDPSPAARFDAVFAGLARPLWQMFDDPSEVA